MKLLGLRICDHDSNITLYDNGNVIYYKLERDSQKKHAGFENLWEWEHILKDKFNTEVDEIDEIAIVLDGWLWGMGTCPNFPAEEIDKFPSWLGFPNVKCKVWWLNHHLSHALSHNIISEKEPDLNVVIDGFGDKDVAWSVFKKNNIVDFGLVSESGSFGQLYEILGKHLNITGHHLDIAGKLMGLQSYGNLDYEFYESNKENDLITIFDPNTWIKRNYNSLLISENRKLDWAKTCHHLMELKILEIFKKHANPDDIIGYSGGVALNVCWNTTLKNEYKNLEIIPHCTDDGLSIGCVEWLRIKNGLPKTKISNYPFIQSDESPLEEPSNQTIELVAEYLKQGKIVGWYQGHGEAGPRALGNRSILMNPTIVGGRDYINGKVKHREEYRPFGATILKEHSQKYFKNKFDNPYMLYSDEFLSHDDSFKSIRHIDNTCRTQTLENENPIYRKLLEKFYEKTGVPMLLNTSLNRGGKPICGSIRDAFHVYYETELDCLVVGNEVYIK